MGTPTQPLKVCCDVEMRSCDKRLTPVGASHLDGSLAQSVCRSPYVSEREGEGEVAIKPSTSESVRLFGGHG